MDIVDGLWKRIQATDIQLYVASLKEEYQCNPRSYKLILQDITTDVGNINPSSNRFGGRRGIVATYTKQGQCSSKGVHTPDGLVYIGTYTKDQWLSNDVKAYHKEIRDARTKHSNGPPVVSRNQKRRINAVKRAKNKLKKLKAEVAATQQHKPNSKNNECGQEDCQNGGEQVRHSNARDAFGGKRTKGNDRT